MDHPELVETYTVPEAADALGRSLSTIRRWIEADKFPAPILRDAQRGYLLFSAGELSVAARLIHAHELEFSYMATGNTHIVETLHQAIHAYRAHHV